MGEFIGTAWSNGGTACGVKISAHDRDLFLRREWGVVELIVPGEAKPVAVNVDKSSMWDGSCRELIHRSIKDWLTRSEKYPWPNGSPPRIKLTPSGQRSFSLSLA